MLLVWEGAARRSISEPAFYAIGLENLQQNLLLNFEQRACGLSWEVSIVAKGNNAQGKDKKKAKAAPKKDAKAAPKKPAPPKKKS